jgi:hypothetical protein
MSHSPKPPRPSPRPSSISSRVDEFDRLSSSSNVEGSFPFATPYFASRSSHKDFFAFARASYLAPSFLVVRFEREFANGVGDMNRFALVLPFLGDPERCAGIESVRLSVR